MAQDIDRLRELAQPYLLRHPPGEYLHHGIDFGVIAVMAFAGLVFLEWAVAETMIFTVFAISTTFLVRVLPKALICPEVFRRHENEVMDDTFVGYIIEALYKGKSKMTAFNEAKFSAHGGHYKSGIVFDAFGLALWVASLLSPVFWSGEGTEPLVIDNQTSLVVGILFVFMLEIVTEVRFHVRDRTSPAERHPVSAVPWQTGLLCMLSLFVIILPLKYFIRDQEQFLRIVLFALNGILLLMAVFIMTHALSMYRKQAWLRVFLDNAAEKYAPRENTMDSVLSGLHSVGHATAERPEPMSAKPPALSLSLKWHRKLLVLTYFMALPLMGLIYHVGSELFESVPDGLIGFLSFVIVAFGVGYLLPNVCPARCPHCGYRLWMTYRSDNGSKHMMRVYTCKQCKFREES